ncbi:hypothetical protein PV05_10548 [Exophiala xenobiotica]|uniref:SAP domain-containing protein n=1 Tax=Exophiala xenobiotica TaxID=348802 RepID=A0A0D2BHT6_9EURO|nr:uncharacterized protein PV05_10548 [Exophiala xenobiotica]KIW51866.1 hypothetical protein PV05_10548 [Exophiala xenobiotica]
MTDWNKFKVTDLKKECTSRGIPLTGLKLKQQYIDKLVEYEAENVGEEKGADSAGQEEQSEAHANGAVEEPPSTADDTENGEKERASTENWKDTEQQPPPDTAQIGGDNQEPRDELMAEDVKADIEEKDQTETNGDISSRGDAENEKLPELQAGHIRVEGDEKSLEEEVKVSEQPPAQPEPGKAGSLVPQSPNVEAKVEATKQESAEAAENLPTDAGAKESTQAAQDSPSRGAELAQSDSSTPLPAGEVVEDQRRRRKRSATPVPTSQEIARKKARLSNDGEDSKAEQITALKEMQAATEIAKEIRNENDEAIVEGANEQAGAPTEPARRPDSTSLPDTVPAETHRRAPSPRQRSRSPPEERDVPPAMHLATSSLYIRNFKRPLHIPSLRSHLVSLAKSSHSSSDSDPIKVFYLDSIRTHAFVSFSSVSAASRVRIAMHGTRFPDESMREPLFVDYIPDDKVQSWIDQETGGGLGGGRGSGRRFEVAYEEGENGVEAMFQEVDTSKPQQRPPVQPRMSSRMSIDRPAAGGMHPDRTAFVPRESPRSDYRDRDRGRTPPPTGPRRSETSGRGFKALDELFESTTAKPKLYYKPVPESVASERLGMFRNLRVGHAAMGRSGDEGMKRYSFERNKNREEWVDKGPEFGFGKRGQDRLVGTRGRGGYRGRGDSWRGGSGR